MLSIIHSGICYLELFYKKILEPIIGTDSVSWYPIVVMFYVVWNISKLIVQHNFLAFRKQLQQLKSLADACYWAVKNTDRPETLKSYVSIW